jgi:hypothetical protein
MSLRSPKLPPAPPPPPNPNDEAARGARERELRSAKRGRRSISLTSMVGSAMPGMSAAPSLLPGRATVTGG